MRRIAVLLFAGLTLGTTPLLANPICWFVNPPPTMDFGTYTGTTLMATTSFSFACDSDGSGIFIRLSRGTTASYTPRRMERQVATPIARLNYNLYQDAANTMIWGDGTGGSTEFKSGSLEADNAPFVMTIYGTLPGGQNVPAGTYLDMITISIDSGANVAQHTFIVRTTVGAQCTVSTTPLGFGAYDPLTANAAAPKDATGVVDVFCSTGTAVTVSLDLGSWASGSTRRMQGSVADYLTYEIYLDAARTIIWNAVNTNSGTSTSNAIPINGGFIAYGRIFAGQSVNVGNYSDSILVTVNY
jgi:spore coat protein U-like protein